MERRAFLVRLAAMSAGLISLLKGTAAWAKGLPSDSGGAPVGAPGADLVQKPGQVKILPFETGVVNPG